MRSVLEQLNTYQALKRPFCFHYCPSTQAKTSLRPHPILPQADNLTRTNQSSPYSKKRLPPFSTEARAWKLYHRDDEFSRGVVRHFAYNLKTMIGLCRDAGVPVDSGEPPCNLKDFSPFKSEHAEGFTVAHSTRLTRCFIRPSS